MHISTIYLSSYSSNALPEGYADISHDNQTIKITFSERDRASIHQIVLEAYQREQVKLANLILNNSPTLKLIESSPEGKVAEFAEVDDGCPF